MPNNLKKLKYIWLVGGGKISKEYLKVLPNFNYKIVVITRRRKKISVLKKYKNQISIEYGGLSNYLKTSPTKPDKAIIAVNTRYLHKISKVLIDYGIKSIMVEKPAALKLYELKKIKKMISKKKINYVIAYNRRFYGSINYIQKLILNNKVRGVYFDLTEWVHKIKLSDYSKLELRKWFLCNTSHIIDLVFYLVGQSKKVYFINRDAIKWHKPVFFNGNGITKKNIPFVYRGDWLSHGRWEIKIFFKGFVAKLKPIESLNIEYISKKNIKIEKFKNESKYKPGFYNMCNSFIKNNLQEFCTIDQQINNFKFVHRILGWED
jgi:hypothetical protein